LNGDAKMKKSTKIRHIPYGLSPYKKDGCERIPAEPIEGDLVIVNTIIETSSEKPIIILIWSINGIRQNPKLADHIKISENGKFYYTFELGRFSESDKVCYFLQLEEDNDLIQTKEFEFCVFKKYKINEILDIEFKNNLLVFYFKEQGAYRSKIYLCFENGYLRMLYSLKDISIRCKGSCSFKLINDNLCIYKDSESGHFVEVFKKPFKFVIKDEQNNMLFESSQYPFEFIELSGNSNGDLNSAKLNFLTCNDYYYGFGERFNKVNQGGMNLDVHVIEQFTNQNNITYMPMPFFITEKDYGMFLNSSFYTRYSLATEFNRLLEIETRINENSPFVDLYIFFGKPKSIIKQYLDIAGDLVLPPKWAFGPWMSSNRWNTQKETLKQVDLTIEYEIPATVVVLEAWSDETTFYVFNDAKYKKHAGNEYLKYEDFSFDSEGKWPDPKKMIDYFHDNNMKLILWQIPVIKYFEDTEIEQHIVDEQYAINSGFCVANKDGSPYRITDNWFCNSLVADFTNPQANDWWFNKRKYLLDDLGVDGFKTDGGEFIYHDDLCFYNGKKGDEMRNMYPISYISGYHDFAGKDRVTFSRAGFTGAQKYPIYWAGDQVSTFAELRSVLNAGLSINISGNPFWSFDIAGFAGKLPEFELYIRSTQLAVFCPVMQYHSEPAIKSENNDRTPWNVSEWNNDMSILEKYRRYANIRMNLLPYIYQEAQFIAKNNEPLMRHLIVDYSKDRVVYNIEDEFLFGRSLLIAPIIDEGKMQRDIYLPEGEWIDFWEGTSYTGGSYINYLCDIDTIPVFIKNNCIIPLNLNNDFKIGGSVGNEVNRYIKLCFIVTGQIFNRYEFSDDIGNTVVFSRDEVGLKIKTIGDIGRIYIMAKDVALINKYDFKTKLNNADYFVKEIMYEGNIWEGKLNKILNFP
jgi:alpha-D-xyloside xylohydrolase